MKAIFISDELHKQLKVYAANHNNSMTKIAENAIGNLLSQKAVSSKPASPALPLPKHMENKSPISNMPFEI